MQAIDFRLERLSRNLQDELVRAWWNDAGFAGRCPTCGGWIHFTIREKQPIDDTAATSLLQLPDDWFDSALVLWRT